MVELMKPYVEYLAKKLALNADDPLAATGRYGYGMGSLYWGSINAEAFSKESLAKDYYFMYYNTLALFQYGGETWEKYNKVTSDWLLKNQHQGKKQCLDGSWERDRRYIGSRVYSTSFNALQLQVYYRYKKHGGKNKKKKK